jgi:hypothetical protein
MEKEENEITKENTREKYFSKWWIIAIIVVILLLLIFGCSNKNKPENSKQDLTEIRSDEEFPDSNVGQENQEALTPEEVIAQMERAEGIGVEQGPIEVEIISPEEKSFMPSQARHYRAEIKGLKTGSSCYCDWKFYLNENNEEVLYREMDDRQCTSVGENQNGEDRLYVCGFTTTFIDKIGELRVEVEVEVEKQGEIVETEKAYKKYIVQ